MPPGGAGGVGAGALADEEAAALGGGSGFAAAWPAVVAAGSEMTATMAPTGATLPSGIRISASMPATIDGTSIEVLSVSISNSVSPAATASPAALNHLTILPSATVSPSC